jgi:hypothetical protein
MAWVIAGGSRAGLKRMMLDCLCCAVDGVDGEAGGVMSMSAVVLWLLRFVVYERRNWACHGSWHGDDFSFTNA